MSGDIELVKKNVSQFLAVQGVDLPLVETDEGPVVVFGEEEVPVFDKALRLSLIQPGAVTGKPELVPHINKYFIDGFEESYGTLTAIPVCVVNYTRVLYDGEFKAGETKKALCRSGNGVTPHRGIEVPVNPVCAEVLEHRDTGGVRFKEVCPKAMFSEGARPECSFQVTVGMLIVELGYAPVYLSFHGKSLSPFNQFQKKHKETAMKARIQRKSIKDYVVSLGVDIKGTYSTPILNIKFDPELNAKQYAPLVSHYANTVFRAMAEAADREELPQTAAAGTQETIETVVVDDASEAAAAESFNLAM